MSRNLTGIAGNAMSVSSISSPVTDYKPAISELFCDEIVGNLLGDVMDTSVVDPRLLEDTNLKEQADIIRSFTHHGGVLRIRRKARKPRLSRAGCPCTLIKDKMKDRVEARIWNMYHRLNKNNEYYLIKIVLPDGVVLPIKWSSQETIQRLVEYIQKFDASLHYVPFTIFTHIPELNITSMPPTYTIKEAGIKNKTVMFVYKI